jgi:peptide/nickel transport system permease protein
MSEHRPAGGRSALVVLGLLVLAGLFAPLLANDKPLLARVRGRLVAPAWGDLPLLGGLLVSRETSGIAWEAPGPEARPILRAPVPFSFRGISLDEALGPPGRRHLLGTDALGRDLLARLIHAARPSLAVGFGAILIALVGGGLLGTAAGLGGGLLDLAILRLADVIASFPPLVLALAFAAGRGRGGLGPVIAAVALNRLTGIARYVRGEILRHSGSDLWAAARATGRSPAGIVLRHLLPLLAPPLAVLAAFGVAHAIVLESSLSFVGLGVEPPAPSWGTMLAESRGSLGAAWWPVVFPSAALLLVLAALCAGGERAGGAGGRGTLS